MKRRRTTFPPGATVKTMEEIRAMTEPNPPLPATPTHSEDARIRDRVIYGETFVRVTCPWGGSHHALAGSKTYKRHRFVWTECHVCKKSDGGRKVNL